MDLSYLSTILIIVTFVARPVISKRVFPFGLHMFPFGPEAGDEQLPVENLPQERTTHDTIMFGKGVAFDKIKLFIDGHVELTNPQLEIDSTPHVAPYHLPYSQVTSGHVWYRETQDFNSLEEVKDEIQQAFPYKGFTVNPKSMMVVTWQFRNVSTRYPECEPAIRAGHETFCGCVNGTIDAFNNAPPYKKYKHLWCECFRLFNKTYKTRVCVCVNLNADYKFCTVLGGLQSYRAFDARYYARCVVRGGTDEAALCSARFNFARTSLEEHQSCDVCECSTNGTGKPFCPWRYCNYLTMDPLKCFLLNVYRNESCWRISLQYFPYVYCEDIMQCQKLGNQSSIGEHYWMTNEGPIDCGCLMADALNEAELMGCLLLRGYHDTIWLCENSDLDLDYCTCIQDRIPGDVNDEIYCKCEVYSSGSGADFCQCLDDHNYNGTMPNCARNSRSLGCHNERQVEENTPPDKSLNTFQAVLVYNEWETFVYFTYQELTYVDLHVTTRLGHVDAASKFTGHTHNYSGELTLITNFKFDSNMGVGGRWIYRISAEIDEPDWTPSQPIKSF